MVVRRAEPSAPAPHTLHTARNVEQCGGGVALSRPSGSALPRSLLEPVLNNCRAPTFHVHDRGLLLVIIIGAGRDGASAVRARAASGPMGSSLAMRSTAMKSHLLSKSSNAESDTRPRLAAAVAVAVAVASCLCEPAVVVESHSMPPPPGQPLTSPSAEQTAC